MKYKVGDKVRIKSIDWYNENKNEYGYIDCGSRAFFIKMSDWCGKIATIKEICKTNCYRLEEYDFDWTDDMIEGLVEEEKKISIKLTGKAIKNNEMDVSVDEYILPEGYIFKDENGNVINAMKIVLEKKKKEVILTQKQIDTMVHESCVLFCKHYGCGIPRETCTSLGTCKEHDDYRKSIRTHFESTRNNYGNTNKERLA